MFMQGFDPPFQNWKRDSAERSSAKFIVDLQESGGSFPLGRIIVHTKLTKPVRRDLRNNTGENCEKVIKKLKIDAKMWLKIHFQKYT